MKNVSALKSDSTNSPKTPGGISKSLLTPCRRVGLSRNWRNKGPSPFISPLSGSTPTLREVTNDTRKRKSLVLDDNIEKTSEVSDVDNTSEIQVEQSSEIDKTPSRNVQLPRKKKSKTLLIAINRSQEDVSANLEVTNETSAITIKEDTSEDVSVQNIENIDEVSTPVRTRSKKSKKQSPRVRALSKNNKNADIASEVSANEINDIKIGSDTENCKDPKDEEYKIKERSPNDLRKECIVVIQRKIFKKTEDSNTDTMKNEEKHDNSTSQALFDSDSDEIPLNQLNSAKNKSEKANEEEKKTTTENIIDITEDDDFVDKSTKVNVNKVKEKEKKSPKHKLKTNKPLKLKTEKVKVQPKPSSQSSYDDDDDDFDTNKKTIIIRKTYEKVSKPLKAKSTGSITQQDIDELKARIETKKKLLLAQSINPDTAELRNLIKKWQKGCQNALMELLDLMKTKFHDKQDMDYAEMLRTLKIPPSLVGYDAENDCFNEPNDASIILHKFQDL
ncbi:unnamed protein product [Spodoptera littoralis]|uniref:Swi5-dependent recombination DNA repair protein 1 homolog n=1 Tax=Spodoptera littoralis TaxID=7109 RepID=A0A9P0I5D3_SPOLI|nr:unnamed protein product [Spodoptera littoralis]CAH1641374.1 unnamed protein product [Spodoptera littoralis]